MEAVRNKTNEDIPEALRERDVAKAFYGIALPFIKGNCPDTVQVKELTVKLACRIDDIILTKKQVDWNSKSDVQNMMKNAIEATLYELVDEYGLQLDYSDMDTIIEKSIDVGKRRGMGRRRWHAVIYRSRAG